MKRRESREVAVKIIFEYEFNQGIAENLVDNYFEFIEDYEPDNAEKKEELEKDYILDVVKGTLEHRDESLELIEKTAKGWKLSRIVKIDLAILLVALYEVFYKEDVPASVAINEAVDIAKKYGRPESGKFVNGILGTIYRAKTGENNGEKAEEAAEDIAEDINEEQAEYKIEEVTGDN